MNICTKCGDEVSDGVSCNQCRAYLHFYCSGLSENTYRRMTSEKKENWRCIGCRNSISPNASNIADILKELKEFRKDFEAMKSDVNCMNGTVQDLASHWQDVNTRLEVMEGRLECLEVVTSQVTALQKELKLANNTIEELRVTNKRLEKENDKRDQHARLNNLEISGVPLRKGENLVNLLSIIYNKVGLTLEANEINCIHRVRRFEQNKTSNRPPAIIVRYVRQFSKDQLLAAVRMRRGLTTTDIGLSGASDNK